MAKSVFYSFHYDRDAWRVQQIIQMGALEGQPILKAQEWEEVKRKGDAAIKKWIADQMAYKSAVVVLIGAQTANRPWVLHEISHAWKNRKPLVGIRIHGLADRSHNTDSYGDNPFSKLSFENGGTIADYVPVHNPSGLNSQAIYADIKTNITTWVGNAYRRS
ncbi:MAG: TIR domain-containing protein [Arachnia propionica]|uniref:TIR domain-containing protein n=1 Tax=Arachnia propionica TaxID=1750 RepID=UPI002703C990|nr:TIR domain-containing protein [Arachnia propionica]